ncbi:MAG: hypothetical protein AB8G99_15790 [Planctomycetaceae bacterium]
MTPADRLLRIVKAKNKELDEQAKAEFTIGAVFAAIVLGVFFVGAFLIGLIVAGGEGTAGDAVVFALPLTFAVAGVTTFVAWQSVAPKRQLLPMDDPDEMMDILSSSTPAALNFVAKHELPGGLGMFFGGPENILKGYGILQNKVPEDPELLERSTKLLKRCEEGYSLRRMKNPQAAVLLRQLSLVRVERRDDGPTLVFTDDGRMFHEAGKSR